MDADHAADRALRDTPLGRAGGGRDDAFDARGDLGAVRQRHGEWIDGVEAAQAR